MALLVDSELDIRQNRRNEIECVLETDSETVVLCNAGEVVDVVGVVLLCIAEAVLILILQKSACDLKMW